MTYLVAERFRRACEEVEAARAAKREKNAKKAKNRRANRMGCAERMIHVAMDDGRSWIVGGDGTRGSGAARVVCLVRRRRASLA